MRGLVFVGFEISDDSNEGVGVTVGESILVDRKAGQ